MRSQEIGNKQQVESYIEEKYNSPITYLFSSLNIRYADFHESVKTALENNNTELFSFAERLKSEIRSKSFQRGAKESFDGPSACGVNSCGDQLKDIQTLACITGCMYSSGYCITNGGGALCDKMLTACNKQCCRDFCTLF